MDLYKGLWDESERMPSVVGGESKRLDKRWRRGWDVDNRNTNAMIITFCDLTVLRFIHVAISVMQVALRWIAT
jgi:hypothetical protein